MADRDEPRVPADWEGAARMAAARRDAGVPLNAVDRDALRRHPNPTGWVGEETTDG